MQAVEQLAIGVVEDSDADFYVLNRLLSPQCEVTHWATSEDALAALGDGARLAQFGAFFVDFQLPGIDGVEFVRRLRSLPGGEDVRLIMLSGTESEVVAARALSAGADAYEYKPSSLDELRALVGRSLEPLL